MRVLVVGGAGYIGNHVVLAFQNIGAEIVVLDNLSTAGSRFPPGIQEINADYGESTVAASLSLFQEFDAAVVLAGLTDLAASFDSPRRYEEENCTKFAAFLRAMQCVSVKCLVFASSAAIYRESLSPITEQSPLGGPSPYGTSKLQAEQVIQKAFAAGLCPPYAILRYFNVAGADPLQRAGRVGAATGGLFDGLARASLTTLPSFEVYGADYPSADGTAVRDFVHVTDVAEINRRVVDLLLVDPAPLILNCGSGIAHSVEEVILAFERVTGRRIHRINGARRMGDLPSVSADIRHLKSCLGWSPELSDLPVIVNSTLAWQESRLRAP